MEHDWGWQERQEAEYRRRKAIVTPIITTVDRYCVLRSATPWQLGAHLATYWRMQPASAGQYVAHLESKLHCLERSKLFPVGEPLERTSLVLREQVRIPDIFDALTIPSPEQEALYTSIQLLEPRFTPTPSGVPPYVPSMDPPAVRSRILRAMRTMDAGRLADLERALKDGRKE